MGQTIIRSGSPIFDLVDRGNSTINSATISQEILADDTATFKVVSRNTLDLKINDYTIINGSVYRINNLPSVTKNNEGSYEYDIEFQGLMYDLIRCQFFNADDSSYKSDLEFPLIGTIEVFLLAIKNNMKRFSTLWEIGNFTNGETKTITFSSDNCLTALQKICQEFKVEFWVKSENGKFKIHTGSFGSTLPITLEYGKGKGLYKLTRRNVNDNDVVSRLYVNGGSQNIPNEYRNFSTRLKLPGVDYLEDTSLIDEIGLIEGNMTFDDIYPTRTGVISSKVSGSELKFVDSSMDFDLKAKNADGSTKYLISGTAAKIAFNTGNLAGYQFEVKNYDHTTKTFEIISFANDQGQKFPDTTKAAFQFSAGDEYKILDIIMPDNYITAAENLLLTKATEQFELKKQPKVSYSLDVDPDYFISNSINPQIGDYVKVVDVFLGINKVLRIQKISKDIITNKIQSIEIADSYEVNYNSKLLLDVQDIKNVLSITKLGEINLSKLGQKTTEELKNMIFDTDDYFKAENIKPFSIETNMLTVGSRSQQLSTSLILQTNVGNNANVLASAACKLYSQTFDKEWTISELSLTLPDNNSRYIYAKASKTATTGTIFISIDKKTYDSDPNDYYFLLGILTSVIDGIRVFVPTIGSTTINGGLIRTGTISSNDGQTSFNLNTGEIKGKITFTSDSPAISQVINNITIGGRNLLLNSSYELTFGGRLLFQNISGLKGGETVSISYDAKYLNGSDGLSIQILNGSTGFNGTVIKRIDSSDSSYTRIKSENIQLPSSLDNLRIVGYLSGSGLGIGYAKNFKLEIGNKATDWTPAPEDVDANISFVQNIAASAITKLNDISSDSKLTASEKQTILVEWNRIKSEYLANSSSASNLAIPYTAYQNSYNSLNAYITPLLSDLSSTSDIVGSTFRVYFNEYYNQNISIVSLIENKKVDNVQVGGRNLALNSKGDFIATKYEAVARLTLSNRLIAGQTYILSFNNKSTGSYNLSYSVMESNYSNRQWISPNVPFVASYDSPILLIYQELNQTVNVNLSNIKLEKGNKVTDWTLAPEDIDSKIVRDNLVINSAINETSNAYGFGNRTVNLTAGKTYTFSFNGRCNNVSAGKYLVGYIYLSDWSFSKNIPISTTYDSSNSITFTAPYSGTYSISFYYFDSSSPRAGSVTVNWCKVEEGIYATSWNNSIDDILSLEKKTNFLSETSIKGNAVATGSLIVGNSAGANAGMTGLGSDSDLFIWGGSNYENRNTAKWGVTRDGRMYFRHPNGNVGFLIGIVDGTLTMDGWHSNGTKLFELSPNRGLVNIAYISESWTVKSLFNFNVSSSTLNTTNLANILKNNLIRQANYLDSGFSNTGMTTDTEVVYTFILNPNYSCFDYYNGTHPNNLQYADYVGYKSLNGSRTENIPNGWYGLDLDIIYSYLTQIGLYEPQTIYYTVYYISSGKITQTGIINFTIY